MNKFVTLFFLMINLLNLSAQNCLPSGITFSSQTDIDNFSALYPNCTIIDGPVCIGFCNGASSGITNLNGLLQLNETGSLTIAGNSLNDLSGLDNLVKINGTLRITRNFPISSLNGLNSLQSVADSLVINTDDIIDLNGLSGLKTIGKGLLINGSDELISLQGLDSINSIGFLHIRENEKLQTIADISSLRSINGEVIIENNDELISLNGLDSITIIHGDAIIRYNDKFTNLLGLNSLERVNGRFLIDQSGTTDISDIDKLKYTKGLVFAFFQITDLSDLEQLDTIDGDFGLVFNFRLKTLSGLEDLEVINGSINLLYNDSLMNIDAISSIDPSSISSTISSADLRIENNDMLSNCSILSICEALTLNIDSLIIMGNATGCNSETEIETGCSALPVNFSNELKALLYEKRVLLEFSVASQINNDHFEVEHSIDGKEFEQIGIIQGEGTSFEKIDYNFAHPNPNQGVNYYRIKQVDFNSSYDYSNVALIEIEANALQLYPNPVRDKILIHSNRVLEGAVYNSYGRVVSRLELVKGMNEFDLSHLVDGIYFIVTSTGEEYKVLIHD